MGCEMIEVNVVVMVAEIHMVCSRGREGELS